MCIFVLKLCEMLWSSVDFRVALYTTSIHVVLALWNTIFKQDWFKHTAIHNHWLILVVQVRFWPAEFIIPFSNCGIQRKSDTSAVVTKQLWAPSGLAAASFPAKSCSDCSVTAVTTQWLRDDSLLLGLSHNPHQFWREYLNLFSEIAALSWCCGNVAVIYWQSSSLPSHLASI